MSETKPAKPAARRPLLDRAVAMRLAATEYDRGVAQLRGLSAADWGRPTACPGWDVRAMACHMLGMTEMWTSLPEQSRQLRAAKRAGGVFIDALTGRQVADRLHLTPDQIIERMASAAPRAARFRRRIPAPARRFAVVYDGPIGARPNSPSERWTLGYLCDVITTRDPWMHRVDIADATGAPLQLTAAHDGVIVTDAAKEWAARHGQPVELVLTGPAGGEWRWGEGGPRLELDAVQFCRLVSARATQDGLLAVDVPF